VGVPRRSAASDLRERVEARLRSDGQRVTAGRLALVDVLARATRPLAIPEILERDPSLATSSAYRNLQVLEGAGLVHRIVTDEHARYELADDLTEHHHHLICSVCGSVEDVPASEALEASVERAIAEITRRTGVRTQHHRVDLVGRCRRCA
jgi:Fur family ferric uptake transcriptional regulator